MYSDSKTIRLISRARLGSRSGLGDLLESYRPLLNRLAHGEVGSKLRVRCSESDLVQETMLTASRGFVGFRGSTEREFRAWLVRVFQTRLADGLRHHVIAEKRRLDQTQSGDQHSLLDRSLSPSDVVSMAEESGLLLDGMMELDSIDRSILLRRYMDQQSFEEISKDVGLPLATVWRRWNRAMEQLRRCFPMSRS